MPSIHHPPQRGQCAASMKILELVLVSDVVEERLGDWVVSVDDRPFGVFLHATNLINQQTPSFS